MSILDAVVKPSKKLSVCTTINTILGRSSSSQFHCVCFGRISKAYWWDLWGPGRGGWYCGWHSCVQWNKGFGSVKSCMVHANVHSSHRMRHMKAGQKAFALMQQLYCTGKNACCIRFKTSYQQWAKTMHECTKNWVLFSLTVGDSHAVESDNKNLEKVMRNAQTTLPTGFAACFAELQLKTDPKIWKGNSVADTQLCLTSRREKHTVISNAPVCVKALDDIKMATQDE